MNIFLQPEASDMYERLTDSTITPVQRQVVIDEYMARKPNQTRDAVFKAIMAVLEGK